MKQINLYKITENFLPTTQIWYVWKINQIKFVLIKIGSDNTKPDRSEWKS